MPEILEPGLFQSVKVGVGKRLITFTAGKNGVGCIDEFTADISRVHWIVVDFEPSDPADTIHPQIRIDSRLVKNTVLIER